MAHWCCVNPWLGGLLLFWQMLWVVWRENRKKGKIREHIIDSNEKVTNTKRSNKSWSSSWSHGSILCCQINSWDRQVAMKYMMDLMVDLSYWGVLLHHVWLISSSGLAILLKDHWGNHILERWTISKPQFNEIFVCLATSINNISSCWCPRSNLYIKK